MPGTHSGPAATIDRAVTAAVTGAVCWIVPVSSHAATNPAQVQSVELNSLSLHLTALWMLVALLVILFTLYSAVMRARQRRSLAALRESENQNFSFVTALRESEEKFRILAHSSPTAIMLYQDDTWIYANPAAESICGYTMDELKELRFWEIIHPDYVDQARELGQRRLQGDSTQSRYELKIISREGRSVWVDLSSATCTMGGRPAGIISVLDITQRKAADQACRESEAKYRSILENIEEGYFELDLKGRFTFFNNSLCRILGQPREKLLGMDYRMIVDPAIRRKLTTTARIMFETLSPREIISFEVIRGDRTMGIMEMSLSLIMDEGDKPCGFRGIIRDVTERKRLEIQLLQAQKMEAVGTLAGGIAHDFNNMLMAIQGNTSLLRLEIGPEHLSQKRVAQIEQCVESGSALTRQLLNFARGERYEVRAIDVNALLKGTLDLFEQARKELKVHRKLHEGVLSVEVDKGQVEQVLLNLYVNAWQAMPGGGELFLETSLEKVDKQMALSYDVRPGRYARMSVTDTGTGMDEQTLRRIFEPFFTTKEASRNTGLGLASAYGIVRNHGGFITVTSRKNNGSTFEVYLPISDKHVAGEECAPQAQTLTGTETILLVDDEPMIIEVGSELLKGLGYQVLAAKSGSEALTIFTRDKDTVDLVILDMIMPGMGGSETFDGIMQIREDAPVILSSGYSLDSNASEIMKRGCRGFIQKPFDLLTLSRKIREVLDSPNLD